MPLHGDGKTSGAEPEKFKSATQYAVHALANRMKQDAQRGASSNPLIAAVSRMVSTMGMHPSGFNKSPFPLLVGARTPVFQKDSESSRSFTPDGTEPQGDIEPLSSLPWLKHPAAGNRLPGFRTAAMHSVMRSLGISTAEALGGPDHVQREMFASRGDTIQDTPLGRRNRARLASAYEERPLTTVPRLYTGLPSVIGFPGILPMSARLSQILGATHPSAYLTSRLFSGMFPVPRPVHVHSPIEEYPDVLSQDTKRKLESAGDIVLKAAMLAMTVPPVINAITEVSICARRGRFFVGGLAAGSSVAKSVAEKAFAGGMKASAVCAPRSVNTAYAAGSKSSSKAASVSAEGEMIDAADDIVTSSSSRSRKTEAALVSVDVVFAQIGNIPMGVPRGFYPPFRANPLNYLYNHGRLFLVGTPIAVVNSAVNIWALTRMPQIRALLKERYGLSGGASDALLGATVAVALSPLKHIKNDLIDDMRIGADGRLHSRGYRHFWSQIAKQATQAGMGNFLRQSAMNFFRAAPWVAAGSAGVYWLIGRVMSLPSLTDGILTDAQEEAAAASSTRRPVLYYRAGNVGATPSVREQREPAQIEVVEIGDDPLLKPKKEKAAPQVGMQRKP